MHKYFLILNVIFFFFSSNALAYIYDGVRWDKKNIPVAYSINNNSPSAVNSAAVAAINSAFQTWNNVQGSSMSFQYIRETSLSGSIDGSNVCYWGTAFQSYGSLAVTGIWYDTGTKLVEEIDLEFNSTVSWSIGGSGYDLETVALHEAGHWLVLSDIYDDAYQSSIMYGYYIGTRRSLFFDDIEGIKAIYAGVQIDLLQNAPNPFKPKSANDYTIIGFQVGANSQVLLRIYNLAGELVKTLIDTDLTAGNYTGAAGFKWHGDNGGPGERGQSVGSGVYFYQLKIGNSSSQIRKLMLIR
ncbi:MAG: matrixin family metalloprotease [Elusimicrobiota bacterium]